MTRVEALDEFYEVRVNVDPGRFRQAVLALTSSVPALQLPSLDYREKRPSDYVVFRVESEDIGDFLRCYQGAYLSGGGLVGGCLLRSVVKSLHVTYTEHPLLLDGEAWPVPESEPASGSSGGLASSWQRPE